MVEITPMGSTLRVLRPAANILAFYDGRVSGKRAFSIGSNWVDDGAYSLGVCTYAVVDGADAIVYDTHISMRHAEIIRAHLQEAGVQNVRVVLSHWHLDHIAGNAVFADCEIIAHRWTKEAMLTHRVAIEAGRHHGMPAISPLVMPTRIYDESLALTVGRIPVELHHVDIHSRDGTMLVLPEQRLLLAGDALEDTVTYIAEPAGLTTHLRDLDRMAGWDVGRILPNHGDPDRIAAGGYGKPLISATRDYIERLLQARVDSALRGRALREFVAQELADGSISYFEPYDAVHRQNLAAVLAL